MTRRDRELAEFFEALEIGLHQLYDAADALSHVASSLAEGCTTPDESIGDMNEVRSRIFAGATSVLDAVAVRMMVHEVPA